MKLNKKNKIIIFLYWVWKKFEEDKCKLYAGALTFVTLLTLVPFLAFIFAISKGLGISEYIRQIVLTKLVLGRQEILLKIIEYIQNTDLTTLGTTGVVFLILVVLKLLGSMEEVFNKIWGVKSPRRITRKLSDYLTIVVLCPIFIFLTVTIPMSLKSAIFMEKFLSHGILNDVYLTFIKFLPYLFSWAALSIFYMFMPNTKVNLSAGLLAALISGSIWQLIYWGYLKFQFGVARYNAIYGTFASLPLFMVWLYISWIVILWGAEFAYIFQNRKKYFRLTEGKDSILEVVNLLTVLKLLVYKFNQGKFPIIRETLSSELPYSPPVIERIINHLIEKNVLLEKEGELYWIKNPSTISLKEVFCSSLKSEEEAEVETLNLIFKWDSLERMKISDLTQGGSS
ncbi:MAG: ribonuclease BN [Candidatus Omnitrophota bacterium]|nr:MAG: ribonuclease BN [Candidatus Omnitrophota bacterium]